MDIHSVRSGFD